MDREQVKFDIGDVVVLNSGGNSMTVESVEDDRVKCVWHDGKTIRDREFFASMLQAGDGTIESLLEKLGEE